MSDGTVAVQQASPGDRLIDNEVLTVDGQTVYRQRVSVEFPGDWGYYAGASGTVVVGADERVLGITAHATTAGSMTINGGDSIPIPANTSVVFTPERTLTAPTVVLTGTDSYIIEILGQCLFGSFLTVGLRRRELTPAPT